MTGTAGAKGGVKPRVGLAGAGRAKDPAAAGKATAAVVKQKSALGGKGKTAAVVAGGMANVAAVTAAEPEGEVKAEDEREMPVEGGQIVSTDVSSEKPHDTSEEHHEEHHEEHVEMPASDLGSHEDEGSVPTSPLLEDKEIHHAEEGVLEDNVTSPLVSGSEHEHDHEHEHPGETEHGSPQLGEEQQAESVRDDVPALLAPSEKEVAEAAAHPGTEDHLEKVVPPYQPSVLPTGEQVDEEKREQMERIPDDA